jgi:demethylmenaquinone methyltransferase/2-methoxy-6-polyprenyl-1,4-benzoquinol methylase
MATERILDEQMAYYRARAAEYDEWFFRRGRHDLGPEHRRLWFDEVAQLEAALAQAGPVGDVLELACGTGIWTQRLASTATRLTAVDASAEVIAFNRARVADAKVTYLQTDIFRWQPPARHDFIFFGFWLSHVPADQFEPFWNLVRSALRPGGKVFFVDSQATPEGTPRNAETGQDEIIERRLNDGRLFRIVKIFHDPRALAARLAELGWAADVRATPRFFIHGSATLRG